MGVFFLFQPIPARAAGALDVSDSAVATGFSAGPRTLTPTAMTLASNAVLVCWVAIWQDVAGTGTVSAASWNGVSMVSAIASTRSTSMAGEMWYLKNPTTGSSLSPSITVTGATDGIRVACASFTGLDNTAPLGVTNTATGASGNPAVSITTGTANSVSVAGLSRFANTAITATTFTNVVRANANSVTMVYDYNINTTATSYTATETGSAAQDWIMGVAEFKPASGGGGGGSSSNSQTFINYWWW